MTNREWFLQIESKIVTILKTRLKKRFEEKYPWITFTTQDVMELPTRFPVIYVHELSGMERGNDLEGDNVGAVMETIQIDIYAPTKGECKEVMNATVLEMKNLRFDIISLPIYLSGQNVSQGITRCRRMIGSEDEILI